MKIKKYIFYIPLMYLLGCVNSGMYNSSIGEKANTKYSQHAQAKPENKNEQLALVKKDTLVQNDSPKLKEIIVFDTIVKKQIKTVSIPINEHQKDSLLFALIKDKTLTEEQRSKRLAEFVQKHQKEEVWYDTVVEKRIKYDSVYTKVELSQEQKLLLEIEELKKKLESAQNNSPENQISLLTPSQLYNFGYRDGEKQYDVTWYTIISILLSVTGYGFLLNLILLLLNPKINFDKVISEYKNDLSYRKGFKDAAKKKKNRAIWKVVLIYLGVTVLLAIVLFAVLLYAFLTAP